MKRLLGLLLVMGIVGCGGGKTVDLSETVSKGGLRYEINSETPFTGVMISKWENGQKHMEATYKDGTQVPGTWRAWDDKGNVLVSGD